MNCPQHHNALLNNIISISAQHPYFAQHITRGLYTTSLLINKWNRAHCYDITLHNQIKSRGLYTNYYSQHHNKVAIVTLVSPSPPKASSLLEYNMHWVLIFFYIDKHDQTGWWERRFRADCGLRNMSVREDCVAVATHHVSRCILKAT